MSYKVCNQFRFSGKSENPEINQKVHGLRDYYKALTKQNRAGADSIWGSIVPPLFVPITKGGPLRVLETAIIGEKNPAHLYTKIVNKVVPQY